MLNLCLKKKNNNNNSYTCIYIFIIYMCVLNKRSSQGFDPRKLHQSHKWHFSTGPWKYNAVDLTASYPMDLIDTIIYYCFRFGATRMEYITFTSISLLFFFSIYFWRNKNYCEAIIRAMCVRTSVFVYIFMCIGCMFFNYFPKGVLLKLYNIKYCFNKRSVFCIY